MTILQMIVMIARRLRYDGLKGAALGLLIALSIILRLLGPASMPAKAGYVAICLGADIVYVQTSDLGIPADDGQDAPDDGAETVSCIWFSGFHAIALDLDLWDMPQPAHDASRHRPLPDQRADQRSPRFFHARGPPHPFHHDQG